MTLAWPTGNDSKGQPFPQAFRILVASAYPPQVIQNTFTSGPPQIQLIDTVVFATHTGIVQLLSTEHRTTFINFWKNPASLSGCSMGANPFLWFDPVTKATVLYKITAMAGPVHAGGDIHNVNMTIQEVPT